MVFLILISLAKNIHAADFLWTTSISSRTVGLSFVPNPFLTYSAIFADSKKDRPMKLWIDDEKILYYNLLKESLFPKWFLFQTTIYPTAILSSYIKSVKEKIFNRFKITENFNLLSSLGSGYEEPYSFSIFLGEIATFRDISKDNILKIAGGGIMGYVLTFGDYQIMENTFLKAQWFRLEWKVKGYRSLEGSSYNWNFRVGIKHYGISDIRYVFLISLERERIDHEFKLFSLINNCNYSIFLYKSIENNAMNKVFFVFGKRLFVKKPRKIVAGIDAGFSWEKRKMFIPETKIFMNKLIINSEFIIRPYVKF